MTRRDTPWPAGTPCWVDLAVPDVVAATAFYGEVLGWSFVDTGEQFGNYHVAQVDGRSVAAIGPAMEQGQPSSWTPYLATEDAEGTAELIAEHGGTVLSEPMDIPGNGRMCLARDPTGATFGIWQSAGMHGFGIANEPGAVTWNDVRVGDLDRAKAFYAAVFGYTYEDVPDAGGYATMHVDGNPVSGIVAAPEGIPAHWLTYVSVADVDAAMATAARAGATVLMPAEDSDFGRIGIFADPVGATLALHRAPED